MVSPHPRMKCLLMIVALALVAGCASDDARLHGTWQSNRDETVSAALRLNPALTNLPPERLKQLKDAYGDLTMTYSNGMAIQNFRGKTEIWRYQVIESGADYVVIRSPMKGIADPRIRFVDDSKGYWVSGVTKYDERFDKVENK
jgi:hypothetical protein